VYLIDTNVVSEARKKARSDPGVLAFFEHVAATAQTVYLSVVTIGELRRGIERMRHRDDPRQAALLEDWLEVVLEQYGEQILDFDADAAQVWGRLRAPNPDHAIDKQVAAIALVNDLTIVTRNTADFEGTGARVVNPFSSAR
jgi:hypothetical protein